MRRLVFVCLLIGVASGCSAAAVPPTLPTATTLAAGTWSGNVIVQSAVAQMSWSLTQNGASVAGPIRIGGPADRPLLNGYLSGTLSGTTLSYSIDVPAGDIPAAPACAGRLVGKATLARGTPSTLTGAYAFAPAACDSAPVTSGTFTLTSGVGSNTGPVSPS